MSAVLLLRLRRTSTTEDIPDRRPERLSEWYARYICQKECQDICQKVFQNRCQKEWLPDGMSETMSEYVRICQNHGSEYGITRRKVKKILNNVNILKRRPGLLSGMAWSLGRKKFSLRAAKKPRLGGLETRNERRLGTLFVCFCGWWLFQWEIQVWHKSKPCSLLVEKSCYFFNQYIYIYSSSSMNFPWVLHSPWATTGTGNQFLPVNVHGRATLEIWSRSNGWTSVEEFLVTTSDLSNWMWVDMRMATGNPYREKYNIV